MKRKWAILFLSASLLLTACQQQQETESPTGETVSTSEGEGGQLSTVDVVTTTENQLVQNYYRPLLVEGRYLPSESRGITLRLNSDVNLKAFELGLMSLSTDVFPTADYLFQEGQVIPEDSVRSWLRREDPENNPEGLNPVDNQETDPSERNPIYLQSLLEQNYYVETDSGPQLAGISLGLAMNQVDYYRKEQFGAEFETKISREELLKQGQEMGNELVRRIRALDGMDDIPIVVGIFEQATRDHFGGGVFISQGTSKDGASTVKDWKSVNERKEVFPLTGNDTSEGNSFKNFKSEVETFFPNLSGVTGVALYREDMIVSLDVSIVTQFYGTGEIIAFTQVVQDAATKYLPPNLETEITIDSIEGPESFLYRETGESTFKAYVFKK